MSDDNVSVNVNVNAIQGQVEATNGELIDDEMATSLDAFEYTQQLKSTPCDGDPTKRETVLRVLCNAFPNITFYSKRSGVGTQEEEKSGLFILLLIWC